MRAFNTDRSSRRRNRRADRGESPGCSSSATVAARPTRHRWRTSSVVPRGGRPVAARHLGDDGAVLTALSNDVGFDLVFARQLIAHGAAGDIAVGLVDERQLAQPPDGVRDDCRSRAPDDRHRRLHRRRDGATSGHVQHCLVVDDDSVHRIQEAQAAVGFELWRQVQARLTAANTGVGTEGGGRACPTTVNRRCSTASTRSAAAASPARRRRHARPTVPGGKASAALIDAVFVDAFSPGERAPLVDAATPTLPSGERSGVQHGLVRGAAAPLSRAARSGTSPSTGRSTTLP